MTGRVAWSGTTRADVLLSEATDLGSAHAGATICSICRRSAPSLTLVPRRYPRQSSLWRADGTRKQFSVYIMSNNSMTLYTGVTNDLPRRAAEHRRGGGSGFTSRYHFDRVVYFEFYDLVSDAISREKSIKGMTRSKKTTLIKSVTPTWSDPIPPLP